MSYKNALTYRKITRQNCARNFMGLSITVAMDNGAPSYIHDQLHLPISPDSSSNSHKISLNQCLLRVILGAGTRAKQLKSSHRIGTI